MVTSQEIEQNLQLLNPDTLTIITRLIAHVTVEELVNTDNPIGIGIRQKLISLRNNLLHADLDLQNALDVFKDAWHLREGARVVLATGQETITRWQENI